MVQSVIDFGEQEDRVLNIVKGLYGLKNKSEAVNLIIGRYGDELLEPQLNPEYKKELLRVDKGKHKKFSSIKELRKEIEGI